MTFLDNRYNIPIKKLEINHVRTENGFELKGELDTNMKEWLKESKVPYLFSFNTYSGGTIYFNTKDDLILFKLAWG